MANRRTLRWHLIAVSALALSACSTTPELDKQFSRSTRSLFASQVMHSNPSRDQADRVGTLDGKAARSVMDAYHGSSRASGNGTVDLGTR